MSETENINSGPSLTIHNGIPCFFMEDGSVKVSSIPELFNASTGSISYAPDFMNILLSHYGDAESMRNAAQLAIDEYGLLDKADEYPYSIWLLVAMTCGN